MTTEPTILDRILAHKAQEVAQRQHAVPLPQLKDVIETLPPCRGFAAALRAKTEQSEPAVIAEIKRASPSKGLIRADFEPAAHARSYEAAGAACLSVLTDEAFFQGHDDHLRQARAATRLPVLRKDFVIDDYQLYEARALGADCVLLIVAALDIMRLTTLYQCARNLGLDVLIEVHDATELAAAQSLAPAMIGINNRDLRSFETSVDHTLTLAPRIEAPTLTVTESGISTREVVRRLQRNDVHCFLVGEAFMREPDPGAALSALFSRS
ncbi:MAG: indole-3-glycerol phosphate synthase TrpC [Pseudomonadota bacterium]